MMIKDSSGALQQMIMTAVDLLREPAGKKYRSMKDIHNNRDQFIKDFHRGLYSLHVLTIDAIIHTEDKMLLPGSVTPKEVKISKKGWSYIRQLFRCINDSIFWIAYPREPGLFVRRTCRNQERGKLKDQNPESILKTMKYLFAEGQCLPIWNDATRCIDIGDITLFSPSGVSFVELKSGKVNQKISDMMHQKNPDIILKDLNTFVKEHGDHGIKQINRIIRQEDRASKLVDLVENDKVYDPFLDMERNAIAPSKPFERFEDELTSLFKDVRSKNFVEHSIDDCLHVLVFNRLRGMSIEAGQKIVKEYFQNTMSQPSSEQVDCTNVIMSLDSSFGYPTSMPIMLRSWLNEDIAKISLGHTEVYFGFDINAWAKHLQVARLVWSSTKQGKAEFQKPVDERLLVVHNKIPQLIGLKGNTISLGTMFLQIMLCEGVRPKSLARYYDQFAAM
ncbi:MAG: hypothetical protein ABIE74_03140 [Pseudomonadota bacterium]